MTLLLEIKRTVLRGLPASDYARTCFFSSDNSVPRLALTYTQGTSVGYWLRLRVKGHSLSLTSIPSDGLMAKPVRLRLWRRNLLQEWPCEEEAAVTAQVVSCVARSGRGLGCG